MNDFTQLFNPTGIAVVGVSEDLSRPSSQSACALIRNGYSGGIYPVNPKYEVFEGLQCFPSVVVVPNKIDLVVIGVPAKGVLPILEECVTKGVPFVLILSGGFRETGDDGIELERKILRTAKAGGVRILDPNCLGFVNVHSNVFAAFGSMTRPPQLKPGSVSLVTQSGGFGYSIALSCAEQGIGFRHVIATGNESDINSVQLIEALLSDDLTKSIVVYVEGVEDGRALLEVGRKAMKVGKPIFLWKGGVTEQGAKAAASHTASMTGRYDFYQALFKQTGIVEIQELSDAVDFLQAFAPGKLPQSNGVAVMGVSGGSAIVFADAGERVGLNVVELQKTTQDKLSSVVPNMGAVHNPIDLTAGYFSQANQVKLSKALEAVLDDPAVDSLCVNLATTGKSGSLAAAQVLAQVSATTTKPIMVFSSAPKEEFGPAQLVLTQAGIPVLSSPSRVARAIGALLRYRQCQDHLQHHEDEVFPKSFGRHDGLEDDLQQEWLSEVGSKKILKHIGIAFTDDVVLSMNELESLAVTSYPVVVKVISKDIPHKTEVGGVKIGVANPQELRQAIRDISLSVKQLAPKAHLDGMLISPMVMDGFEMIAGVINDQVFGPVLVIGAGGIYTEVLSDVSCRLAPFGVETAMQMIKELKCLPILQGARGRPKLDLFALANALVLLSQFAWEYKRQIMEIDINPLFVLPKGVVGADALIALSNQHS